MSGDALQGPGRHWEGWQLGLLAVALAVCAAWLALPRPVPPALLPLPVPRTAALALRDARDALLVEQARDTPPPFDVRAVGELVRRHGAASAAGDARRAARAREDAMRAAETVLAVRARRGAGELQALRAVQTSLFLEATDRFRRSGKSDRELDELGGDFLAKCRAAGWLDRDGGLVPSDAELRVLFQMRWVELLGLRGQALLAPSIDQYRAYYRFLLEHPEGASPDERERRRLVYLGALARRDAEFPADYARGVVLARLGRAGPAAEAWRNHLAAHPNGSWSLRAQNHLLWALAASPISE